MLSPRDEEEIPAKKRAKREKKRVEEKESSAYKPLSLLTYMKIREKQFREELRWRDETLAAKNKRREENIAVVLQQRDK